MNKSKTKKAGLIKYALILPATFALIFASNAETLLSSAGLTAENKVINSENEVRRLPSEAEWEAAARFFAENDVAPDFYLTDDDVAQLLASANQQSNGETPPANDARTLIVRGAAPVASNTAVSTLFIVNGEIVSPTVGFRIPPEQMESMEALHGEEAIARYGERGKGGVVIIRLKSGVKLDTNNFPPVPAETGKPLIIIDGEVMGENFRLNDVSPENIESVTVLRGDEAVARYGERARDGVVEIVTKR